eukprot:TRINITY_DN5816_c0_g1_i1.p1 TRINITY_DN5816_c0_g1~~TRINITY_DN5816_c0_g1_i1.p1  ORF type:complete len:799 (-),score=127.63 TRINITY_DN5816_c0_g1_i1:50-2446(-)
MATAWVPPASAHVQDRGSSSSSRCVPSGAWGSAALPTGTAWTQPSLVQAHAPPVRAESPRCAAEREIMASPPPRSLQGFSAAVAPAGNGGGGGGGGGGAGSLAVAPGFAGRAGSPPPVWAYRGGQPPSACGSMLVPPGSPAPSPVAGFVTPAPPPPQSRMVAVLPASPLSSAPTPGLRQSQPLLGGSILLRPGSPDRSSVPTPTPCRGRVQGFGASGSPVRFSSASPSGRVQHLLAASTACGACGASRGASPTIRRASARQRSPLSRSVASTAPFGDADLVPALPGFPGTRSPPGALSPSLALSRQQTGTSVATDGRSSTATSRSPVRRRAAASRSEHSRAEGDGIFAAGSSSCRGSSPPPSVGVTGVAPGRRSRGAGGFSQASDAPSAEITAFFPTGHLSSAASETPGAAAQSPLSMSATPPSAAALYKGYAEGAGDGREGCGELPRPRRHTANGHTASTISGLSGRTSEVSVAGTSSTLAQARTLEPAWRQGADQEKPAPCLVYEPKSSSSRRGSAAGSVAGGSEAVRSPLLSAGPIPDFSRLSRRGSRSGVLSDRAPTPSANGKSPSEQEKAGTGPMGELEKTLDSLKADLRTEEIWWQVFASGIGESNKQREGEGSNGKGASRRETSSEVAKASEAEAQRQQSSSQRRRPRLSSPSASSLGRGSAGPWETLSAGSTSAASTPLPARGFSAAGLPFGISSGGGVDGVLPVSRAPVAVTVRAPPAHINLGAHAQTFAAQVTPVARHFAVAASAASAGSLRRTMPAGALPPAAFVAGAGGLATPGGSMALSVALSRA